MPTFAPSKPKKKRNLLLLSSDLSRGWQAAFTLKDLRESREVNGDLHASQAYRAHLIKVQTQVAVALANA